MEPHPNGTGRATRRPKSAVRATARCGARTWRRPGRWIAASACAAWTFVALAAPTVAAEVAKRGVGISASAPHHDQLACLARGLWYYNWSLTPSSPGQDAYFVPMVRGERDMETVLQTRPSRQFDILLLFNEPNKPQPASLSATPTQLAQYTTELAPYAKFLVSPTPGRAFKDWFAQYMGTSEAKNDLGAVAVHWYGPADFGVFKAYIQGVESAYRKPIWLTEFAVIDHARVFNQAETAQFLDQALPFLDQDPMVQRYAWFGLRGRNDRPYKDSAFIQDDGRLTLVGQRYLLGSLSPAERARRMAACHVEPES